MRYIINIASQLSLSLNFSIKNIVKIGKSAKQIICIGYSCLPNHDQGLSSFEALFLMKDSYSDETIRVKSFRYRTNSTISGSVHIVLTYTHIQHHHLLKFKGDKNHRAMR